jgi:hypothetical protein
MLNLYYVRILFVFPVVCLILLSAQINRQKYFSVNDDTFLQYGWLKPDKNRELYHSNYKKSYQALEEIQPYLRELGIKRSDKVISIPDYSPNISLYLMDQKGYTDFGFNDLKNDHRMDKFIQSGAGYLIINDSSLLSKRKYLKSYTSNQIGEYKNVSIYKLNNK